MSFYFVKNIVSLSLITKNDNTKYKKALFMIKILHDNRIDKFAPNNQQAPKSIQRNFRVRYQEILSKRYSDLIEETFT